MYSGIIAIMYVLLPIPGRRDPPLCVLCHGFFLDSYFMFSLGSRVGVPNICPGKPFETVTVIKGNINKKWSHHRASQCPVMRYGAIWMSWFHNGLQDRSLLSALQIVRMLLYLTPSLRIYHYISCHLVVLLNFIHMSFMFKLSVETQ